MRRSQITLSSGPPQAAAANVRSGPPQAAAANVRSQRSRLLLFTALGITGSIACNAILDNPEGHLVLGTGGEAGSAGASGAGASSGSAGDGGEAGAAGSAGAAGEAGEAGSAGAGGAAGGSGGEAGAAEQPCASDEDCIARLPLTTPADCAQASCDTGEGTCAFAARDADEDGYTARDCSADGVAIETGDDCDDQDQDSFPGAWDGPEPADGSEPDRCDEVDQDCDATPDNGELTEGGETRGCACDPANPRPCYEYPNGVPIDADTLDVGICQSGTQMCDDGVPGACVDAVGPGTETCNDEDDDCDGMTDNDAVGSVAQCEDVDGDSYCTSNCVVACDPPAGHRPQTQCLAGLDCDDSPGADWIHPTAAELCGDGVDSNCMDGDNEEFPELGDDCVNGTYGVCRRLGNYVCAGDGLSTVCDAAIVSPGYEHNYAATDADIDPSTARGGYDPHWDWNCDNVITQEFPIQEGTFRAAACTGYYEEACNGHVGAVQCDPAAGGGFLGQWFFNCESTAGGYLSGQEYCGHTISYIVCSYGRYDVGQCDYWLDTYVADNGLLECE